MDKNQLVNDICEAKDDSKNLYELLCNYNVSYSALEIIILDFLTDNEDNKDNILKLLKANNLRFFRRTNTIINNGYSLREYASVFFNEETYVSEETFREYKAQLQILETLEVSVTTQKIIYEVSNATNKERLLVFVKKYGFSSIENLEEQIFSKIIKKTAININNMFRLLEANNLDFASKLNKLIINGYNEFEYFEAVYSKKYPGNRYIPRNISNEYIMYSNIIKQLGISLYTQKLVYDVCNAGLDKTKIFYLIQKYNSKFLENLERKLLKRLSLEDNFVSKLNFRRLFEANNLDFIKMANNIASNGYTLEKFDRIVMCKSFTHKTNNKVAKSVCNSYDKYRQIIEFAGIPFKEETVSIEKEAKKIIRKNKKIKNVLRL